MRIQIIRSTICGGVHVDADQVVEASEHDAHVLLLMRKARPVPVGAPSPRSEPAGERAVVSAPERAVVEPAAPEPAPVEERAAPARRPLPKKATK